MYCEKCHRQSPDNFDSCIYCSEPFQREALKPSKFVKQEKKRKRPSRKTVLAILIGGAFFLCVAAIITGTLTGEKPESVVRAIATAVETSDEELYFSLFDNSIKEYKKSNWYFNDEETFSAMSEPLRRSVEFYSDTCGENLKVTYKINATEYLSEEQLGELNDMLTDTYGYSKLPSSAARLDFEIRVSGDKGEYKSVYRDFYCIKINGKWYKTEYDNSVQ